MAISLETLLLAKQLAKGSGGGGEGGTTNYNQLSNKPSINGATLQGNISLATIGALAASDVTITDISGGHKLSFGDGKDLNIMDGILSNTITTIWTGTQAQYDAITTKDTNTLYFIKEE